MEKSNIKVNFTNDDFLDFSSRICITQMTNVSLLSIKSEEHNYTILEYYCKNSDCDCQETYIKLYDENRKKVDYAFDFNYITKEADKEIPEFAKPLFLHDVYCQALETKHAFVKNSFQLALQKRKIAALEYANNPKSLGRNDICYCGSGKKYKKCCGK